MSWPGVYRLGRYWSGHTGSRRKLLLLLWSMSRLGRVLRIRSGDSVKRINDVPGLTRQDLITQAGTWRSNDRGVGLISKERFDLPEEQTIALGNPAAAIYLNKIGVVS